MFSILFSNFLSRQLELVLKFYVEDSLNTLDDTVKPVTSTQRNDAPRLFVQQ